MSLRTFASHFTQLRLRQRRNVAAVLAGTGPEGIENCFVDTWDLWIVEGDGCDPTARRLMSLMSLDDLVGAWRIVSTVTLPDDCRLAVFRRGTHPVQYLRAPPTAGSPSFTSTVTSGGGSFGAVDKVWGKWSAAGVAPEVALQSWANVLIAVLGGEEFGSFQHNVAGALYRPHGGDLSCTTVHIDDPMIQLVVNNATKCDTPAFATIFDELIPVKKQLTFSVDTDRPVSDIPSPMKPVGKKKTKKTKVVRQPVSSADEADALPVRSPLTNESSLRSEDEDLQTAQAENTSVVEAIFEEATSVDELRSKITLAEGSHTEWIAQYPEHHYLLLRGCDSWAIDVDEEYDESAETTLDFVEGQVSEIMQVEASMTANQTVDDVREQCRALKELQNEVEERRVRASKYLTDLKQRLENAKAAVMKKIHDEERQTKEKEEAKAQAKRSRQEKKEERELRAREKAETKERKEKERLLAKLNRSIVVVTENESLGREEILAEERTAISSLVEQYRTTVTKASMTSRANLTRERDITMLAVNREADEAGNSSTTDSDVVSSRRESIDSTEPQTTPERKKAGDGGRGTPEPKKGATSGDAKGQPADRAGATSKGGKRRKDVTFAATVAEPTSTAKKPVRKTSTGSDSKKRVSKRRDDASAQARPSGALPLLSRFGLHLDLAAVRQFAISVLVILVALLVLLIVMED